MKISVAVCIYNDFDFFAESIDRIYDIADEIVILDGPYEYCKPILKFFKLYYENAPEPLKSVMARPKVRYEYRTFEDERAKRIALYEMCLGDIIMLLDSDELVTAIHREEIVGFIRSDKSVGPARFHNHVRSNIVSTEDTRKLIFFKRSQISAEQHLNYTWLVGVQQEKPNRALVYDRPLLDIAHLTLMRSPYYSTVKYCFYTRLFFRSKNLNDQIDKLFGKSLAEIAKLDAPMEIIRDIFRRAMPDSLNFPNKEKLHEAPGIAIDPKYDQVAGIAYLDEKTEVYLLQGVKTYYYVRAPKHLRAGDAWSFSFETSNISGVHVEGLFHNGDRCELVEARVGASEDGVVHATIVLPFEGGGRFGALLAFRANCVDSQKLGRLSGFLTKKRIGLYGNCQTENLAEFLETSLALTRRYEIEKTPGRLAHIMSDEDIQAFHGRLHRLDYLIAQPIADNFRGEAFGTASILAGLRPEARVFMMPNLFFTGYAPDSYCVTYRKKFMQKPMPIHDVNFVYSYLKHDRNREATKKDFVAKLRDPDFYGDEAVQRGVEKNIKELRTREREAAVKYPRENTAFFNYSDFVERECGKALLHYSDAHPTEFAFSAVARDLLADLQLPDDLKPVVLGEKGVVPFYAAIGNRLGFEAANQPIYLNDKAVDFERFFNAYCDVYDQYDADELFGYVSRNVTKVIITNHKTGTMLMLGILRDYCKRRNLKLLEMTQHLSRNKEQIDTNVDFQSYDFIFVAHAQHFTKLISAVPRLRYRAIHLIRHPLEIIMSGVRYHQITDEVWCLRKIFVADATGPCGYRRIASYDVEKSGEIGQFSYREIMNILPEPQKIKFEVCNHAKAFGTIPSIRSFLDRFDGDGNVATLRLEDIAAPECIAFVFKFLALPEDFVAEYSQKVGAKEWLGRHITNREGAATHPKAFDAELLAVFDAELGADTIAKFGYAADSPPPVYLSSPRILEPPKTPEVNDVGDAPAEILAKPEIPVYGTAEDFHAAGEKLMAAGRLDLARTAYERSIALDPKRVSTLGRLGDVCVKLGAHPQAIEYYTRIDGLTDKLPPWMYIGLANAYEGLGDANAAAVNLRRAVELGWSYDQLRARIERLAPALAARQTR